MPKLYPNLSVETNGEQMVAVTGVAVTADHANSKRYFIKDEKPTDDEGFIGDVCFVINEEKNVPPEPEVLPPFEFIAYFEAPNFTADLNCPNVFSPDYKNYVVEISTVGDTASTDLFLRWMDDSDVEVASVQFTTQELGASGDGTAAVFGQRYTKDKCKLGETSNTAASGLTANIYDPLGSGATAIRTTGIMGRDGARLLDYASTCPATSYKSFRITTADTRKFKGTVSVYGVRS